MLAPVFAMTYSYLTYIKEGTPYEGGVFRVKLVLSNDFPTAPPKGVFLTKIFHPNVSKAGEICVNTLKKDWKPEYGIAHVLTVVKCLLIHPNAESALNEEAGMLLLERYCALCLSAAYFASTRTNSLSLSLSLSLSIVLFHARPTLLL